MYNLSAIFPLQIGGLSHASQTFASGLFWLVNPIFIRAVIGRTFVLRVEVYFIWICTRKYLPLSWRPKSCSTPRVKAQFIFASGMKQIVKGLLLSWGHQHNALGYKGNLCIAERQPFPTHHFNLQASLRRYAPLRKSLKRRMTWHPCFLGLNTRILESERHTRISTDATVVYFIFSTKIGLPWRCSILFTLALSSERSQLPTRRVPFLFGRLKFIAYSIIRNGVVESGGACSSVKQQVLIFSWFSIHALFRMVQNYFCF